MSDSDAADRQKVLDSLPEWSDKVKEQEWNNWFTNLTLDGARVVYKAWFTDAEDHNSVSKTDVCHALIYNKYTFSLEKEDVETLLHVAGLELKQPKASKDKTGVKRKGTEDTFSTTPQKKLKATRGRPKKKLPVLTPGLVALEEDKPESKVDAVIPTITQIPPTPQLGGAGSNDVMPKIVGDDIVDVTMPQSDSSDLLHQMKREMDALKREVKVLRERKDKTIPPAFKELYETKLSKRKVLENRERVRLLRDFTKYTDLPQAVVEDPSKALSKFKTKEMVPIVKEQLPQCQRLAVDLFRVALHARIDIANSHIFMNVQDEALGYMDHVMAVIADLALDNATHHFRFQRKLIAAQLGHPEIAALDSASDEKELLFTQEDVALMRANVNFRRDVSRATAPPRDRGGRRPFRPRNRGRGSRFSQPWSSHRSQQGNWRGNSTYNNNNYNNNNNSGPFGRGGGRGGRGRGGRN